MPPVSMCVRAKGRKKIADKKTSGTKTGRRKRAPSDLRLISDINDAAGRLLGAIGQHDRGAAKVRPALLDQTLDAAEEVESFLAEQSARIQYLENLTLTDELTNLKNRRGFNEHLRRTLAAAQRYGDQGVLVFCDLDNFKFVNDNYGHHVGDYVLRQLAKVLEKEVRGSDLVARLGGDEFAALMVQTNWRDGLKRAQMLNRAVNRTVVTYHGTAIPVNASFGVEPFGPNDEEANLVARADMAMYVNKRKKASLSLSRNAAE